MLLDIRNLAYCTKTSSDLGLKRELITALAETQVLEHAAKALLLAAEAAPGAAGAPLAANLLDETWGGVSAAALAFCETLAYLMGDLPISALCPLPRVKDVLTHTREQLDLQEQLRPLLAGPGVQLCATWAALCTAMTIQEGADGSVQQLLAPISSRLRHGLPPGLMRPLATTSRTALCKTTTAPYALAVVIQATTSGPCDLAIAQPPVGYDRLAQSPPSQLLPQVQPQRGALPSAGSSAAETAETAASAAAAAAAAQGTQATAAVPYSAVHAYELLYEIWHCLACDGASHMRTMYLVGLVMARLLTELRPGQAAVRLPGWWRQLAQAPTMLIQDDRLARELGHLLRLQLHAPPPPAWAGEAADAASVAAVSGEWPAESAAEQVAAARPGGDAPSAAVAASLARGRDPSYSLRCALDAGLLSTLEQCLRAPQAWREASLGPHSAGSLLNVVNSMLRYSGVWPAVLARGPVQQAVSLIATLGAAARLLEQEDVRVDEVAHASQPGVRLAVASSAGTYLCAYLAAMLEQVADVRALREHQAAEQHQSPSQRASSGAAAAFAAPALHLNSVLEPLLSVAGSSFDKPAHCSIAWMAAAGGLPAPGSAADRQQQLLASFAVHLWLPALAMVTQEAVGDFEVATELTVSLALLVGRLLMAVLWHEGDTWQHMRPQADVGTGNPDTGGEESGSPRPEAAWWAGPQLTEELVQSMHTIAHALSTEAVRPLRQRCSAWQQAAALDLLQSYWTHFPVQVYRMTAEQAARTEPGVRQQQQQQDDAQWGGQDRVAGSSGKAAPQQPASPEVKLWHAPPLPVQALAIAHGRQDIVNYLSAVAETMDVAADMGAAGAASGGSGCAHGSDIEDQVWAEWQGVIRRPHPWLLSRIEVRAGLHELLVAEAAAAVAVAAAAAAGAESAALRGGISSISSSSSSRGGGVAGTGGGDGSGSSMSGGGQAGAGGSSDRPTFGHRLCGNPSCCSLDGPGALIAPRGGKTCVRCRAVTYCCGACQLADWRERHSRTCCGAAGAAAGAVGAVKAEEKRA
ncbi:hypothetical protein HXX76_007597 [Chlamydomonas incerta]|uniref:phytol kinase n=1 Tax=Chlamydomonas incerta TaxID=51695 RepID=A0A835SWQ2_CHLIN|nr:hypothetical protein HXX76_007597 [Chlamydomonas incerta]|eukprot:KAG2434707.1 hypothetical protein HXX76_007597 [Chlamydomonas incerta]